MTHVSLVACTQQPSDLGQDRATIIAQQNDQFRGDILKLISPVPGTIVMTAAIAELSQEQKGILLNQIRLFNDFNEDNDPWGEHDFGKLELAGIGTIFWKIDYYDTKYEYGSENPADLGQTRRVMTIMFASEY